VDATPPKRKPTDWIAARDFWLALPAHERHSVTVARRFGISEARVRFIAKRDNWRDLAAAVDARVAAQVTTRIVRSRADRVRKTLGIVDGLLDRFDAQLAELELRPGELPGLVKLAELLEGEATDRVTSAEAQEMFAALMALAVGALQEGWPVPRFIESVRTTLGPGAGELEAA
jgi:hypothetical protein